jgi:cyanate permease
MRTVWVTVLSVWALFAVVAVLAWTRQQTVSGSVTPHVVVVKGKNGTSSLVVQNSAPAATTRTSPVGAG